MNLQIPITSIRKAGGGVSIFGSIPSTRFLKAMANEWSRFRGELGESGRRGPIGSAPQVVDDGSMISIQATIEDAEACAKAQTGVLRVFKLTVDESTGHLGEVALSDGGPEGHGTKIFKRATMNTVRPEFRKFMAGLGLSADGRHFLRGADTLPDFLKGVDTAADNQNRIDGATGNRPSDPPTKRRGNFNAATYTSTDSRGSADPDSEE